MANLVNPGDGTQDRHPKNPRITRKGTSPFDAIRQVEQNPDGSQFEYWSAREAMPLLGYDTWERLTDVIERAKASCRAVGDQVSDHFQTCSFAAPRGNRGATQPAQDVHMTRLGMYLLAMNGNPRKPEIAAAQTYFAVQTRRAETELPPANVPSSTPVLVSRPYSLRIEQSIRQHRRWIKGNLPRASFSIFTGTITESLIFEDTLLEHLIPVKGSDLPDGSMGRRWADYRREQSLPETDMEAPLFLPSSNMIVQVKATLLRNGPGFKRGWRNAIFPFICPNIGAESSNETSLGWPQ